MYKLSCCITLSILCFAFSLNALEDKVPETKSTVFLPSPKDYSGPSIGIGINLGKQRVDTDINTKFDNQKSSFNSTTYGGTLAIGYNHNIGNTNFTIRVELGADFGKTNNTVINQLTAENNELTQKINDNDTTINQLTAEKNTLSQQISQKMDEYNNFYNQMNDHMNQQLQESTQQQATLLENFGQERTNLNQQITNLNQQFAQEITNLDQAIDDLKQEKTNLDQVIDNLNQEITDLNQQIEDLHQIAINSLANIVKITVGSFPNSSQMKLVLGKSYVFILTKQFSNEDWNKMKQKAESDDEILGIPGIPEGILQETRNATITDYQENDIPVYLN